MTPTIDTRLLAIIGALEHLVLPALANADSLVQEQAGLSLAHLKIIRSQLPLIEDYHRICLREMEETGAALLAVASGGAITRAATEGLSGALAETAQPGSDAAIRRHAVGAAIDALIIASSHDGDRAFLDQSKEIVIEHAFRQSRRDRTWYGATGLDPDRAELGTIEEMVAAERIS